MKTTLAYVGAAGAEIAGCFAFWGWAAPWQARLVAAPGPSLPCRVRVLAGVVETNAAGRAYAAYGGIYIVASLFWLWGIESVRPDRWDIAGAAICLIGAAVILSGPRG